MRRYRICPRLVFAGIAFAEKGATCFYAGYLYFLSVSDGCYFFLDSSKDEMPIPSIKTKIITLLNNNHSCQDFILLFIVCFFSFKISIMQTISHLPKIELP